MFLKIGFLLVFLCTLPNTQGQNLYDIEPNVLAYIPVDTVDQCIAICHYMIQCQFYRFVHESIEDATNRNRKFNTVCYLKDELFKITKNANDVDGEKGVVPASLSDNLVQQCVDLWEDGINYLGTSITYSFEVKDTFNCQQMCGAVRYCQYFSYSKSTKHCWLLSNAIKVDGVPEASLQYDDDITSGQKCVIENGFALSTPVPLLSVQSTSSFYEAIDQPKYYAISFDFPQQYSQNSPLQLILPRMCTGGSAVSACADYRKCFCSFVPAVSFPPCSRGLRYCVSGGVCTNAYGCASQGYARKWQCARNCLA